MGKKQWRRILAVVLAAIMLCAYAPTGVVTAQATVKIKTVKTVNAKGKTIKKVTIKKGKTYQIKTKVNGKLVKTKAIAKNLTFKTSNKKVAKVSKKGKITAIKKGTAKITVTSKKNKKKKTTLKVTVVNKKSSTSASAPTTPSTGAQTTEQSAAQTQNENAYSIVSMEALYTGNIICFSLNNPYELALDDITVYSKVQGSLHYKCKYINAQLTTTDNQNYIMRITESFDMNTEIKISIPKLNGVNEMECEYSYEGEYVASSRIISNTVGSSVDHYMYHSMSVGYCDLGYEGTLPEGITYERSDNSAGSFSGTFKKAGVYDVKLSFCDENNKTYYINVRFCIYSAEQIVAVINGTELLNVASICSSIRAYGGSGNYEYTLEEGNKDYFSIYRGYFIASNAPAGEYPIKVKVTDADNPEIYTIVEETFRVFPSVKVSGYVTDKHGNPINGAEVAYLAMNIADYNVDLSLDYSNTDSDGYYSMYLLPSNYIVEVTKHQTETYFYNKLCEAGEVTYNYQLDCTRVELTDASDDYGDWYDSATGKKVGSNKLLYLEDGQRELTSTVEDWVAGSKRYTLLVNVDGSPITEKLTPTCTQEEGVDLNSLSELEMDKEIVVSDVYNYQGQQFTPEESGKYIFNLRSSNNYYVYACIYDADTRKKVSPTYGTTNEKTSFTATLTGGKTYIIMYYSYRAGTSAMVTVTK